jgi:hypothetical protein
MRKYDKKNPLIVIHVPKAAGVSSGHIFKDWFGGNFHKHYANAITGTLPDKLDLWELHEPQKPLCLQGHFNRFRGFGIEDYYPKVNQFVTILRDPFELMTSHYFYVRKVGANWKDQSRVPVCDLQTFLKENKPNMLNHFPREVTFDNYKDIIEEYFIEIGITERLDESMRRIGRKLGFEYTNKVEIRNSTSRDQEVPMGFLEQFMERNQLEFEVYQYCLLKFDAAENDVLGVT